MSFKADRSLSIPELKKQSSKMDFLRRFSSKFLVNSREESNDAVVAEHPDLGAMIYVTYHVVSLRTHTAQQPVLTSSGDIYNLRC
jgi:hypothetical protein